MTQRNYKRIGRALVCYSLIGVITSLILTKLGVFHKYQIYVYIGVVLGIVIFCLIPEHYLITERGRPDAKQEHNQPKGDEDDTKKL